MAGESTVCAEESVIAGSHENGPSIAEDAHEDACRPSKTAFQESGIAGLGRAKTRSCLNAHSIVQVVPGWLFSLRPYRTW